MKNKLLFWVPTGLLAALVFMSGTFNVTRQPNVLQALEHLGYPAYLATILGVCKLFAGLTLLSGARWPRLTEWAFAGLVFDFAGAFVSHLAMSDTVAQTAPSAVLLTLTTVTYRTTWGAQSMMNRSRQS
jgi:hypothetical protein